jgi:hypothetical protein
MEPKTIDFVITTNYSPYYKSLSLLKKTIQSLNLISDLKTSFIEHRIIIAIDGLHPNFNSRRNKKDYRKFVNDINKLQTERIVISDCELGGGWGCLNGNLCHAFDYFVKSEYVLIMQEDLPFIRDIPLLTIMDHMNIDARLKYVRFNRRKNEIYGFDSELSPYVIQEVHYLKINNWTDNNHLMKTENYRKDILPNIRGKKTFPEYEIAPLNLKNPEIFGTFLYGRYQESNVILHIGHLRHRIRVKMEFLGTANFTIGYLLRLAIICKDLIKKLLD